jgi:hypothetical protein
MSERSKRLGELIQDGLVKEAIGVIQSAVGYHEAESFVSTVLKEKEPAPELLEKVLQTFLDSQENRYEQHGFWVHSLSHFMGQLWERRLDDWIKKFNEVSFKGANELGDDNCSDRLVGNFASLAKWDDDPAEFHLTLENLRWMDWEYYEYAKARIEAGRGNFSRLGYMSNLTSMHKWIL